MKSNKYSPEEAFTVNNKTVGMTVLDFWKYAYADLNADPRDDIAEFLVSNALGIKESMNRQDWTLYDIEYKQIRIEVKCTGYYQTWRESGVSRERRFFIRKATDRKTHICERHNDIYVFCLLNGETREEANPLVLENWEFYVVPTSIINKECGDNKSITLGKLRRMGYAGIPFVELKESIQCLAGLVSMRKAISKLSDSKVQFICEECLLDRERLYNMSEDEVYDIVYETMCDIEVDEVCANGGDEDTERCEIASDIVTILGNAMAEAEGYFDEQKHL